MSGGVDSSVAAALLQRDGYEVVGVFMRLGSDDSLQAADGDDTLHCDPAKVKIGHQGCCSLNDASDARHVAAVLGIPFYVMNFRKDFGRIIDYFVDEYNAGRTPNPCVRCNDWLKFGKLHTYARSIDCDFVATGHYARIGRSAAGQAPALMRGRDHHKDQSYVLFGTPRDRLGHMLLPIGEMEKPAVREMAEQLGLPVFDKPDSQEICFVPDQDYAALVERHTAGGLGEGTIRDRDGQVIGRHAGQARFTIGQRRGIGVALGYPIYVTGKDPATNTVTVGPKEDLLATACEADQTNWHVDPPEDWRPCTVKVRYNSPPVSGAVRATADDALAVRFDAPVEAVTPGQAVVCYDGEMVLGGGWITAASR
jgi:tRNA-specific 2-thiouridylase